MTSKTDYSTMVLFLSMKVYTVRLWNLYDKSVSMELGIVV